MEDSRNETLLGENSVLSTRAEDTKIESSQASEIGANFLYEAFTEETVNKWDYSIKPELITLLGLSEYGKSTFVGSFYHLQ